jgi:phosphonatase-like hydrolase
MQGALAAGGIQVSFAEIADWRGASKREMVRHFVALRVKTGIDRGALTTAIYKDFVARANAAYADVQPIAGAKDAIGLLRSKGFLLATTTGFDRQLSDFIFERLAWRGLFDATVASDEVADGRPAPYMLFHAMELTRVNDVAEVIAVGDTPLDLQAAANAGVRGMIGVYSGAASEERLRKEPHTHILASVAQLPALLAAEF